MTFNQAFFKLYDEKLLSGKITFAQLKMNKMLFTQISNSKDYKPDRELVDSLVINMKLNDEEAKMLYQSAGFED
ncbi:MAG: hypothetical protein MJ145_04645 [Clostridia bacterium]|nr:hypothetical protein [Clostridia bacterium]